MSFHEIRFPTAVAFHATGGPERKTEIVTLGSGFEERNAVWANARRRYDAGTGIRTLDDIHAVIAFFEARLGRLYAFRFKDPLDFKSCAPFGTPAPTDQQLTAIDTHTFQLAKTYTSGPSSWTRTIAKPVAGTVRIAVAGAEQTTGFTLDTTTGRVTFTSAPSAPVTAGFEFDTPVRFDTDTLTINLADFTAGELPNVPLVEVRI
jgi:uncharacterized protein (TIGR02217 family)